MWDLIQPWFSCLIGQPIGPKFKVKQTAYQPMLHNIPEKQRPEILPCHNDTVISAVGSGGVDLHTGTVTSK